MMILYQEAQNTVMETQKTSISFLQRKYNSYNRAQTVETLETKVLPSLINGTKKFLIKIKVAPKNVERDYIIDNADSRKAEI